MSLDQGAAFVKPLEITRDAFLGGKLHIDQPKTGFRAGSDSVLLGASVAPASLKIADLGSGVGTAGLVALSHNPDANALLAERDQCMAALAKNNIASNGFAGRASITHIDVTVSGPEREEAGLLPDQFTSVIANPPYFAGETGTKAPDSKRADARHMANGALTQWVKTATGIATPRGEVIFIYPVEGLTDILNAFSARLGNITVLPIVPRPGHPATRILIRGIKGSRAPMTLMSPLILHGETGNGFGSLPDAIFRGQARLDW